MYAICMHMLRHGRGSQPCCRQSLRTLEPSAIQGKRAGRMLAFNLLAQCSPDFHVASICRPSDKVQCFPIVRSPSEGADSATAARIWS